MIDDQMKRIVDALERLVVLAEKGLESTKEPEQPMDYVEEEPEHSPRTVREKTMEVYQILGEDRSSEIPDLLREMGAVNPKGQISLKSLDRTKYIDYFHRLNKLVA